jgi:hypothetical protein
MKNKYLILVKEYWNDKLVEEWYEENNGHSGMLTFTSFVEAKEYADENSYKIKLKNDTHRYELTVIEHNQQTQKYKMIKDYEEVGKQIGGLLNEKQQSYGDAFGKMEQIFKILYPENIQKHQYKDVLTLARILDKIFRIANLPEDQKDTMGEEPYKDIAGYAILALLKD